MNIVVVSHYSQTSFAHQKIFYSRDYLRPSIVSITMLNNTSTLDAKNKSERNEIR